MKTVDFVTELFDPWPDAHASTQRVLPSDPDDPNRPPHGWENLRSETRQRVGAVALEAAAGGDYERVRRIVLGRVDIGPGLERGPGAEFRLRARFNKFQGMSREHHEVLDRLFVVDEKQRGLWRAAWEEAMDPRYGVLPPLPEAAARQLLRMGDVLATMRARRDALDQQISKLEARTSNSVSR